MIAPGSNPRSYAGIAKNTDSPYLWDTDTNIKKAHYEYTA